MIKKLAAFLLLPVLFSACFLAKEYKQSTLTFSRDGQPVALPLLVPKGFVKNEQRDTAGVTLHTFSYPDGALLYAAYLTDTTFEIQPFDKTRHQPKPSLAGGLVYKGQDEEERYYREIRQGNLRFGYRLVPEAMELQFDSAINYASVQKNSLGKAAAGR